jgi:hypothetical protein
MMYCVSDGDKHYGDKFSKEEGIETFCALEWWRRRRCDGQ